MAAIERGRALITVLDWSGECARCHERQAVTWSLSTDREGSDLHRVCRTCGDVYGVDPDVLTADDTVARPRLLYWEEAEDAWCPAGDRLDEFVYTDALDPDEVTSIAVKRLDMTDRQFAGLPQT